MCWIICVVGIFEGSTGGHNIYFQVRKLRVLTMGMHGWGGCHPFLPIHFFDKKMYIFHCSTYRKPITIDASFATQLGNRVVCVELKSYIKTSIYRVWIGVGERGFGK